GQSDESSGWNSQDSEERAASTFRFELSKIFWGQAVADGDHSAIRSSVRSALPLFQRRVDHGIGADFVILALGPALDRKVSGIDARDAAFTHDNLAEDITVDGHRGAEEAVFPFIRRRQRRGQAHLQGLERNFFFQLAKSGFIHANAAEVEADDHVFGVAVLVEFRGLKRVYVEGPGLGLHYFASALIARRQAVTF